MSFGYEPARWETLRTQYAAELRTRSKVVRHLRAFARSKPTTQVYAAHDRAHTLAIVLRNLILG